MAREVFVVNTCNVWKEYASFRLVGIFTSRKRLNPVLNKMLRDKDIEWDDSTCKMKSVNSLCNDDLHKKLCYISIEIIPLNEKQ